MTIRGVEVASVREPFTSFSAVCASLAPLSRRGGRTLALAAAAIVLLLALGSGTLLTYFSPRGGSARLQGSSARRDDNAPPPDYTVNFHSDQTGSGVPAAPGGK